VDESRTKMFSTRKILVVLLVTLILSEGKVLKQNADESSKKGGDGESQKQEESQKGESGPTKAIEATPGEIEPQPGAAQKSDGDGEENKGASSFEAAGPPSSSSSSSPLAVNLQEPPSIAKDKMSKGDTDQEKVAPDESKDKVNLEETNNAQKDVEVQSPDTSAKGPNPGSKDVKASESDPDQNDKDKIENEEDAVDDKDTVEVVKEPKIDTPLETDFQKQMSSETKDPPQSNFFSYFIVLAIITIIVYLVFHNKKKILGLIVEGRSGRQSGRRRSGGREYRKLDSNMEDMMETGRETSMRQVIY